MRRIPARLRWALFFTVCGLGYVLFVALAVRLDPNARPLWRIDRADALEAVRAYAVEQGVETGPARGGWNRFWHERAIGQTDGERIGRYLREHPGPGAELARRLAPGLEARAQVRTPAGGVVEVWLDPEGRRVGHRRRFPDDPAPAGEPVAPIRPDEVERQRAQEIARASLGSRIGAPDAIELQLEDVELDRTTSPPIHTFTWEGRMEELPELTVEAVSSVRGEVLVRERLSLDLESRDTRPRSVVIGFLFLAVILLALVYAMVRLVRRAKEGEVSRSRGFVLGGVFFAAVVLSAWLTDDTMSPGDGLIGLLNPALGAVLGALALVFNWVALEGDVREALPGKLTTLDTLLSGRLFSRDVAFSTLVGIALAGPALGLLQTTRLLDAGSGVPQELANLFSARVPGLQPYVQPAVLWIGLLIFVPLSFLLRRTRSTRRALALFAVVVPLLALTMFLLDPDSSGPELVHGVGSVVFLILPFLFHDLLAALWTSLAMSAVPPILYLLVQPAPALRGHGLGALALAGLGLVAILVAWRRGERYTAEEVRPVYARNLAERLELLAERRLASAALDRLLPTRHPEIPGVTLAASCHRGSAGGSQFYDLLALPENRLGFAAVALDDEGAAAALRLALLKGLLKTYSARRASPRAVVDGMRSRLTPEENAPAVRFAGVYALYDPASRALRYTRQGAAAELFLRRRDGEVVALEDADAEVTLTLGDAVILASRDGFPDGDFPDGDFPDRDLQDRLAGLVDGSASALHAAIRGRSSSDAAADRTLIVMSTAPESDARGREA